MQNTEEAGVCKIKPRFILPEQERKINLDFVSNSDKVKLEAAAAAELETEGDTSEFPEQSSEQPEDGEPGAKKPRLGNRKFRGQNKNRGATFRQRREDELCDFLSHITEGQEVPTCERKNCRMIHDIDEYLKNKPEDVGPVCYMFQLSGKCPRGLTCRFAKSHTTPTGRNIINEQKFQQYESRGPYITNKLNKEWQWALRKRTYNFDLAEKLVDSYDQKKGDNRTPEELFAFLTRPKKSFGTVTDEDIIKLKSKEKKAINWKDKLYLSPLTTVGNLPFRRICKEYGADITCGEMAMCSSLLQGNPQEWALLKRHHTEDLFGVQICANNAYMLAKCGQLLEKECSIDFVDLNLGCPIDWVFKQGGGSGLLLRPRVLESCVRNLNDILSIPVTLKARTGVYKDESITHEMAPKFLEWGASLLTIHGRSREQRFTKSADWAYIRQVAQAAAPLPVFGNGDVLSYDDYKNFKAQAPEVQGIMIGRGALIKPWIFTELKTRKLYDISSKERFEILRKYANYGLEHWGSDRRGVENTRRFLLEWLSFLYRYIPVGLLERPPQKINERPPYYKGRDDLETLMASPSAADWITISEMFLGKVPEGFKFLPKHKANSYQ